MKQNRMRDDIFIEPGRTGLLSRIFFTGWNNALDKIYHAPPLTSLLRISFLLTFVFGLMILFVSFSPADIMLVFRDSGYETPSIIYAHETDSEYVPIAEFYRFNRQIIDIASQPKNAKQLKVSHTFVAMEDTNFFHHLGIDPQGILRAAWVNLLAGRVKEGASTITQQAARLRFLSNERSLVRKAREAFLSLIVEMKYSKLAVLEIYLNEVPLGHGTFGVEAASRFYFDKSYRELTWGEAALLASLTTRPQDFSPLRDITESRKKVRIVFHKLVESGQLNIKDAEDEYMHLENDYYATLNRSPNDTAFNRRLNLYPYVTEYVKYLLSDQYKKMLLTGGLRIYTTIDVKHQSAAEATVIPYLLKLTEQKKRPPFNNYEAIDSDFEDAGLLALLMNLPEYKFKISKSKRDFLRDFAGETENEFLLMNLFTGERNISAALEYHIFNAQKTEENLPVEGALISMRPETGEITAVVGGSGFTSNNQLLRFIHSKRQPGSSFKPFIYAAGLDHSMRNPKERKKITAASVFDDEPIQFISEDLSVYSPENYAGGYEGPITLRRALTLSKNAVAVRVYEYLGSSVINPIVEKILRLDTDGKKLPREAAVALGSYEMSPYEMARAYALFASGGREVHPLLIEYITDVEGNILIDYRTAHDERERRQILKPEVCSIITSMMEDVVKQGTGSAARVPGRAVAGKTGTTNRGTDAWFVGFTPALVTAVHIGYDTNRTLGRGGTGGGLAAPLWGEFVSKALKGDSVKTFRNHPNLVVAEICEQSGLLVSQKCTRTRKEIFATGTVPVETCDVHKGAGDLPATPAIRDKKRIDYGSDF